MTTWFTLAEAAAYARVSEKTLRRELKAGRVRAFKIAAGRLWRFRRDDLDQWLEGGVA